VTAASDGKDQGSVFRVLLPLASLAKDESPVLDLSAASRILA
jgi:hypothetical protein